VNLRTKAMRIDAPQIARTEKIGGKTTDNVYKIGISDLRSNNIGVGIQGKGR
jgi:hypothetical protein